MEERDGQRENGAGTPAESAGAVDHRMRDVLLGEALVVGFALLVGIGLAWTTGAAGHVPGFSGENDSPETPRPVADPTKSWAFYDRVAPEGAVYYRTSFEPGDRLVANAFTPVASMRPGVALTSPSLEGRGEVPEDVSLPEGHGARIVAEPGAAGPRLEPFTPGAYFHSRGADRPTTISGTVLLALYDDADAGGPVGFALGGREAFTLREYLTVPVGALSIHAWEGDSPLVRSVPGIFAALGGLGLLWHRSPAGLVPGPTRRRRLVLGLSAMGLLATIAMLTTQTAIVATMTGLEPGLLVPLTFIGLPVAIATWLFGLATSRADLTSRRRRLHLALVGVGALATWAGLLVAPMGVLLVATWPRS